MDFVRFAINFLVEEASGDSEYDSVGAAAAAVASPGGRDAALLDVGHDDDDKESAVDAESGETDDGDDGRHDGRECGGSECDKKYVGYGEEEGSVKWLSPEGYGLVEEEDDDRRIADMVEDARERDRRFWETCLQSGYP